LAPNGSRTVRLVVPLSGPPRRPNLNGGAPATWMSREQATVAAAWRERTGRVSIDVPPPGRPLIAALRTALAHILMTRDGPVLRIGRASWRGGGGSAGGGWRE